jgi:hypothetical protein
LSGQWCRDEEFNGWVTAHYYRNASRFIISTKKRGKTLILSCRRCRIRMVVGFSTNYAISAYHPSSCEFEPRSWRGVLDITLCDKVCQSLVAGRWFSLGTPVSSTNKTDCHDIIEILLKVALNTINQPNQL